MSTAVDSADFWEGEESIPLDCLGAIAYVTPFGASLLYANTTMGGGICVNFFTEGMSSSANLAAEI